MKEKKGGKPVDNESKKQEMFEKMRERKREVKVVRKIVSIVALVFLFIIAIGGFTAYSYIKSALEPLDPEATEEIAIDIPMGSGVTSISQILEDNALLKVHKFLNIMRNLKTNRSSKQVRITLQNQ